MLNITKANIKKEIFKFLNKGGDPEALKQRINDIRSEEFINLKNTTTADNTRNSSPGVTFRVHNNNSSISDDTFFWLWFSSSLSHSNRSDCDSSSLGCIGDCSGGDGDGEGCCIFMAFFFILAAIFFNVYASWTICCDLQESKNNGNKILGFFATFAVQASICAGLIFCIIKASEVIVDEKTAALCRIFAGLNAVISAIACLACLCFIIIALYERHQNGKIAEEYAELAMEKLGFIDEKSPSPPPDAEEESAGQKPSAPPLPPNENPSLNSINIIRRNDNMMYSPGT